MDMIVLILQQIKKSKSNTVCLAVKTYELLCPSLPPEKKIFSPRGLLVFVHVNKEKLVKFLKEKYRLFDVSRDIQEIKTHLNNNS
jgi:hypothetical protein